MIELIRNWLNGSREYYTGLAILKRCGLPISASVLSELQKAPTHANRQKVFNFLQRYFDEHKPGSNPQNKPQQAPQSPDKGFIPPAKKEASDAPPTVGNSTVYFAALKEADLLYKQMMNKRAVLFAGLSSLQPYEDPNRPDLVDQRRKVCIDLAVEAIKVGRLYDRSDFVLKTGRLPDMAVSTEEISVENIPDHLVKQKLDNARKNINKMKRREQTPERLAMIQAHDQEIQQLQARWNIIKSVRESNG